MKAACQTGMTQSCQTVPPLFLSCVCLVSHCVITAIPGMHDQTDINVAALISSEYVI